MDKNYKKMENKKQAYRHGEILFIKIDKIPDGLKKTDTDTIITGSNNNPHTFKSGELYFQEKDFVMGYFAAKKTILYHAEHGKGKNKLKEAKLPNGFYEIRRGREFVNREFQPIKD